MLVLREPFVLENLSGAGDLRASPSHFLDTWMLTRGALTGLAQLHLVVNARWHRVKAGPTAHDVAELVLHAGALTAAVCLCFAMHHRLDIEFGFDAVVLECDAVQDCLKETNEIVTVAECKGMHQSPQASQLEEELAQIREPPFTLPTWSS
mmetsp:Transcript_14007/g.37171  ORF Transcript_14007/g.37171 Transcript_14007/m.37171 type:complete len:151 (+) Transcript_14007:1-453(+)